MDLSLLINSSFSGGHIERMLDLGCGRGEIAARMRALVKAKEVFGVDIDEVDLKFAELKGITTFRADLNSDALPFQNNYFDLVTMCEVIEHLYNTDHALSESFRVLKPCGYLLLTTPNLAWWLNRFALLFGYQPYLTNVSLKYDVGKLFRPYKTGCTGQHIRMFTPKSLKQLLGLYGYRVVTLKGATLELLPRRVKSLDKIVALLRPTMAADIICLAQKP